jgi:hypothetical protein
MPSIKRCTNIVGSVATFQDVAITGTAGQGVPTGGTANQVLSKVDATNYNTQWVNAPAGTVADGSITNVKLATMPANTVKMNNTAGVAAPTDVTVANLLTALGAQPLDADLTAIAALAQANGSVIQSNGTAWTAATPAQQKTALGLTVGTDVQAYDADLAAIAGLTATTNNVIQSVGSAWASRTPTQLTATLDLFGTLKGLVPGVASNTTQFLRADGTWQVPPDTTGISQATADGLYLNVTGPDSMTGLLTLTNNATGKTLQVNNSTDRGIDILANNAGLRVMRAVTNTPFIEFYDNTGTTNYGFIQYSATTWTIGKGSTVGLTGSTTGVTANLDLSMNGTKVVLKDATGATTIGTIAYGTSLIAGGPTNALNILNAAGTAGISVTSSSVQVNQLLNMSSGASIAFSGSAGFINAADAGAALRLGTEGSTRMSLTNLLAYFNVPVDFYSAVTCYSTLTLAADPALALQAATKQYVDATTRQVIAATSAATSYTIALADENKLTEYTAASQVTISVPTNAVLAIPVGYRTDFFASAVGGKILVQAVTPGTTTIVATPSATTRAPGSVASLIKLAADRWLLTGDLA